MLRRFFLCILLATASLDATSESADTTQAQATELTDDPWQATSEFDGVVNELHDNGAFQQHEPKRYAWWQIKLMNMGANMYLYYHLCTKKVAAMFGYFKSKPKRVKKPCAVTQSSPIKSQE